MLQSLYDYNEFLEDEDSEPLWLIILVKMPRARWAGLCQPSFLQNFDYTIWKSNYQEREWRFCFILFCDVSALSSLWAQKESS